MGGAPITSYRTFEPLNNRIECRWQPRSTDGATTALWARGQIRVQDLPPGAWATKVHPASPQQEGTWAKNEPAMTHPAHSAQCHNGTLAQKERPHVTTAVVTSAKSLHCKSRKARTNMASASQNEEQLHAPKQGPRQRQASEHDVQPWARPGLAQHVGGSDQPVQVPIERSRRPSLHAMNDMSRIAWGRPAGQVPRKKL